MGRWTLVFFSGLLDTWLIGRRCGVYKEFGVTPLPKGRVGVQPGAVVLVDRRFDEAELSFYSPSVEHLEECGTLTTPEQIIWTCKWDNLGPSGTQTKTPLQEAAHSAVLSRHSHSLWNCCNEQSPDNRSQEQRGPKKGQIAQKVLKKSLHLQQRWGTHLKWGAAQQETSNYGIKKL